MTREAAGTVSVPRDNARSERVCGGVSAAIEKGLVYAAAILTFAVLLFLIGYILVTGIPHLTPSLFSLHYTSENVSMIPAIVTTVEMTALALLLAVALVDDQGVAGRPNGIADLTAAVWDFNNMPQLIYGKWMQRIGTFLLPVFVITNFPGLFLMGELSAPMAVWGVAAPIVFFLIARAVWNQAVKNYTSAST